MTITTRGLQDLTKRVNELWQKSTLENKIAFFDPWDMDEEYAYIYNPATEEIRKYKYSNISFSVKNG